MTHLQKTASVHAIAIVNDDLTIDSASELFAEWCGRAGENLTTLMLSDLLNIGSAGMDGNIVPLRPRNNPTLLLMGAFQQLSGGGKDGCLALVLSNPETLTSSAPTIIRGGDTGATNFTSRLIRGLAHKMNNILTIFHGYSSLFLLDENLKGDLREGLQEIKKGADSASQLLERAVATVRQTSIQTGSIPLEALINSAAASAETYRQPDTQVQKTTDFPAPIVKVDEAKLKTALVEIFRNAFEAVKEGGSVTTHVSHADAGGHALLSIKNDGVGIPSDAMDQIYEPFFTTKKEIGALGLGLAVARSLIEQMEGGIEIVNHTDGVEVRVTLPLAT